MESPSKSGGFSPLAAVANDLKHHMCILLEFQGVQESEMHLTWLKSRCRQGLVHPGGCRGESVPWLLQHLRLFIPWLCPCCLRGWAHLENLGSSLHLKMRHHICSVLLACTVTYFQGRGTSAWTSGGPPVSCRTGQFSDLCVCGGSSEWIQL